MKKSSKYTINNNVMHRINMLECEKNKRGDRQESILSEWEINFLNLFLHFFLSVFSVEKNSLFHLDVALSHNTRHPNMRLCKHFAQRQSTVIIIIIIIITFIDRIEDKTLAEIAYNSYSSSY